MRKNLLITNIRLSGDFLLSGYRILGKVSVIKVVELTNMFLKKSLRIFAH